MSCLVKKWIPDEPNPWL